MTLAIPMTVLLHFGNVKRKEWKVDFLVTKQQTCPLLKGKTRVILMTNARTPLWHRGHLLKNTAL